MRIEKLSEQPVENLWYKTVSPNGQKVIDSQLPIITGEVSGLPENLDAIIVASDLQGIIKSDENELLLGEILAEILSLYVQIDLNIDPKNTGVVLCGDLFATLEKKGGLGDVRNVWKKFNSSFRWVTGVAGNHDAFGSDEEFNKFKEIKRLFYIDKGICKIDDIIIAGISGIIGKPDRVNRIAEQDYLSLLKILLLEKPDFLILHQCPNSPSDNLKGDENIRCVLESATQTLVFCGHYHWQKALTEFGNGTQVLNVDSRAVILTNQK